MIFVAVVREADETVCLIVYSSSAFIAPRQDPANRGSRVQALTKSFFRNVKGDFPFILHHSELHICDY